MSEMYEGVVFRADKRGACHTFAALSSGLNLRLGRLARGVFGISRIAGRADAFDQRAVERVAKQVSAEVGQAIALFYDNRCAVRVGVLYTGGRRGRGFGAGDAWWVPFGEDGKRILDGPRYRLSELLPDEEYDCIVSEIDVALEAVQVYPQVCAERVKQAFCYDQWEVLAVALKLDPILTSESDGYGPVGSDNGADTLHSYQEWRARRNKRETFLARFLRGWELRDEGWDEMDEARIAEQMEKDRFQRMVGDDVAIAFAFAQLIVEGDVAPVDRQRALWAIARQEMPCVLASRGWSEPELRLRALKKMRKALLAARLCRLISGSFPTEGGPHD